MDNGRYEDSKGQRRCGCSKTIMVGIRSRPRSGNVFVERLWRSVKYEEVYLRAYESVNEARSSIGRYLDFYNTKRPHQSLDGATPDQAYFTALPVRAAV